MARIHQLVLLLLAAPAVAFAAPSGARPPGDPLSRAAALTGANRPAEALDLLAAQRPGFEMLGPYHYACGRAWAASGSPEKAVSHYRRAWIYATEAPLKEAALFLAADAEYGIGYYYEAKTDCRIFLTRFPESARTARVRLLLARSLASIGRYREAVRQFDLAGRTAEALYGKANALQNLGMTEDASRVYAEAAAVDPRYPASSEETRCWMGENLRRSGDAARAKELLGTVAADGYRDRAELGLGEIAAGEGRMDEALRRLGAVASSRNRKLARIARLRLADLEAAAGKVREAEVRLEAIIVDFPFTPEHDDALLRLARLRAKAGDDAAALSLLAKLAPRADAGRRAQALDEIERILLAARGKGAGELVALWNAGGRWLMDSSREQTLVAVAAEIEGAGAPYLEIVRWLARYGSSAIRPRYLVLLARQCAGSGDAAGARDCLAALKRMKASGDDALRIEADLRLADKDYRGAAETLLFLKRLEAADVAALSETLPHLDRREQAVAALEAADARYGAGPRPLRRIADALYEMGRRADAERYYRKTLEKDPSNEWACYRLAVLLGKEGGGEAFLARIRKDPTLARMANAARKEMSLDAR